MNFSRVKDQLCLGMNLLNGLFGYHFTRLILSSYNRNYNLEEFNNFFHFDPGKVFQEHKQFRSVFMFHKQTKNGRHKIRRFFHHKCRNKKEIPKRF